MLEKVSDLFRLTEGLRPYRLAVVCAHDEFVVDAVAMAAERGLVEPILIGRLAEIAELACRFKMKKPFEIVDKPDDESAVRHGIDLVNRGEADILMKGLVDTKVLLKGVVNSEWGIKDAPLLSHVGIVSVPLVDRVLFATDGAMNIAPSVAEKTLLIENAVKLARTLGYDRPKVGLVSAVEKVNPKIASTLDADEVKKTFALRGDCGFDVDGPFAIDNLVSADSVRHKGLSGPVAGRADILVFPNLDGGNVFYKTAVFLAGAEAAGLVIGARVPIVLTSRADAPETKLHSIALAVVYGHGLSDSRH
ncbi:MAG: bifunctional enoyl-CoA hydratase/phosphate acetyltransferase [Candidatus Izemoplasmatales bacterium]